MNIIDIQAAPGENVAEPFARAMLYAREHSGSVLRLKPGVYALSSPLARATQQSVMIGALGENPEDAMFSGDFAFTEGISFRGQRGTTLLCDGVTLMVDGFMEPLCLKDCADITIIGLTIDHLRKPFSMGRVERCARDLSDMDVLFGGAFPIDERTPMPRYCSYDAETGLFDLSMRVERREWLGGQRVRFFFKRKPTLDQTGREFYVWHTFHYRPAILIEDSRNITLQGVTIHSQPGMGIVGHRSENIMLSQLSVTPAPGLHMSVNTDATHFTSCRGDLTFEGCRFAGHGDDATNVHTFYHDIKPLGDDRFRGSVAVKTHSLTPDVPDVGDVLELTDRRSLMPLETYRVTQCERDGEGYIASLDKPLPQNTADYWFANAAQMPRLVFRDCEARCHWARTVLIKTRNALVERCTFYGSAMWAIHIAAEGSWREGVACRNVTVRGNVFIRCGQSGRADTGGVRVEMAAEEPKGCPQSHIVIEDNLFDLPGVPHAISVSNASNVTIRHNAYCCAGEPVVLKDCQLVTTDDRQ